MTKNNRKSLLVFILLLCASISVHAEIPNAAAGAAEQTPRLSASAAPVAGLQVDRPLSSNEKLAYAIRHSILSPMAYGKAAAAAGYSMAVDGEADRGYGMGAEGFGRRWADRMGKATVKQLAGSWVSASLLHQDPRYYRSQNKAFGARIGHALSRTFIARGDNGSGQFNAQNLIGIVAGEGASYAWRPEEGRGGTGMFFQRVGRATAWNAIGNLLSEFWSKD